MKTVHWLGAGLSSVPGIKKIALSQNPLILWNRTLAKAQEAVAAIGTPVTVKTLDWDVLKNTINEGDVVVSMLPATFHVQVAQICLEQNAHFVSSSYISPEMHELNNAAQDANLCFVNEVGLDPGLDHLLAHALVEAYQSSAVFNKDNQHFFRSYCGGFPNVPNDFKYKFSWSPLGVLKALKSPAQWLENGAVAQTPKPWLALGDFNMTLANGNTETFQAYPNRDSVPFVAQYGMSDGWNVQEFVRGTLRLNGWAQAWDSLFTQVDTLSGDEGMAKLTEISDDLWEKHQYDEGEADRVVLSVVLEVKDPQGEKTLFKQAYGVDEKGNERGSAMARLVSLTVAIAIESLLDGQLATGVSAAPHDKVTVDAWLGQLAQMQEGIFVSE